MLIATITDNPSVANQLNNWFKQYCDLYDLTPELVDYFSMEEYEKREEKKLDVIFVCLRGEDGFNKARKIREDNKESKMVFISDTKEYQVQCIRLHFSDYIIEPLEFKNFVRAMKLSGVG